eukprot:6206654-Pleurochrysis_carterae.AAC.4
MAFGSLLLCRIPTLWAARRTPCLLAATTAPESVSRRIKYTGARLISAAFGAGSLCALSAMPDESGDIFRSPRCACVRSIRVKRSIGVFPLLAGTKRTGDHC